MAKSDSIAHLAAALASAQSAFGPVPFNATNPFLGNRYADLGAVIEAARPVLSANGLAVSQLVTSEAGAIGVTTILLHASGEWIDSTVTLPIGDEKGKSRAQVAGSVVTYLRRYSLAAVLGLYAEEDRDGQQQPGHEPARHAENRPAVRVPPARTAQRPAAASGERPLPPAGGPAPAATAPATPATTPPPPPSLPEVVAKAEAAEDKKQREAPEADPTGPAVHRPFAARQLIAALQDAAAFYESESTKAVAAGREAAQANGSWGAALDIMETIGVNDRKACLRAAWGVDSATKMSEPQKLAMIRWVKPTKDKPTAEKPQPKWRPDNPYFAAEFEALVAFDAFGR